VVLRQAYKGWERGSEPWDLGGGSARNRASVRERGHHTWMGTAYASHVERQNLTVRMQLRRFTRLANAFSKKLDNLKAALALYFAWYNFCRIHSTLRVNPAMADGIADHIFSIEEIANLLERSARIAA